MKSYLIQYRAGRAVELKKHELRISANSIAEALDLAERKLYLRYPNHQIVLAMPLAEAPVDLTLDALVETWRDER